MTESHLSRPGSAETRSILRGWIVVLAVGISVLGCRHSPEAPAPPSNILLVVIDTLRADAVAGYGAPKSQTPVLAALAREGTLFAQARSTSPWTVPAHASMFTGLFPTRHGAHNEGRALPEEARTLAEILSATHDTAAFSENPHLTRGKQFHQGFAVFQNTWPKRSRDDLRRAVTHRAIDKWLATRTGERPFFLFVNFMDPHLPYRPPSPFADAVLGESLDDEEVDGLRSFEDPDARQVIAGRARLTDRQLGLLRLLYAAEVASADARLGQVIEALRSRNLLDSTLVIVVGDHGENIGDHGLMEHQLSLYETLLRVPMLLRLPGRVPADSRREDPVQLVDLFPTVLEAAGVGEESWPVHEGASLLAGPTDAERLVVAEYMLPLDQKRIFEREMPDFDFSPYMRRLVSIQQGTDKLIMAGGELSELYDLAADPAESVNRLEREPETARRLLKAWQSWQASRPSRLEVSLGSREAETIEALRQLGYVD